MLHDRFELAKWTVEFSLSRLREEGTQWVLQRQATEPELYSSQEQVESHILLMQPHGEIIVEPKDLAIVEQLRAEAGEHGVSCDELLTDVFVFYEGESTRRDVTKIGGLPYWPRNKSWPLNKAHEPLGFLAQLSFADSRDLFPVLPNDVLTIFGDLARINRYEIERDVLEFFWLPLGLEDLVIADDVPSSVGIDILDELREFKLKPHRAEIHRTRDFPDGLRVFDQYRCSWNLLQIEGTKIGGSPRWIQSPEDLSGRFLAALGGCHELAWGEMGSAYLFLDANDEVHWTHQCY